MPRFLMAALAACVVFTPLADAAETFVAGGSSITVEIGRDLAPKRADILQWAHRAADA